MISIISLVQATPPACFLSCVQVIARWCEKNHADFRCICDNSPSLVGCLVDICPYGNFFSARDHFWGTCLERLSENNPASYGKPKDQIDLSGPKDDGLFEEFPEEWDQDEDGDEDEDEVDDGENDEDEEQGDEDEDDEEGDEDNDDYEEEYEAGWDEEEEDEKEEEDDDYGEKDGNDEQDGKFYEEEDMDLSEGDSSENDPKTDENSGFFSPEEEVFEATVASPNSKRRDRPDLSY